MPISPLRINVRRRVDPVLRKPIALHARHAGEIIWCWNILADQLFEVFVSLTSDDDLSRSYDVAHALWHAVQSDAYKLGLLRSVAEIKLKNSPIEQAAVIWLTDCAGDLIKHRNDAAHVPVKFIIRSPTDIGLSVDIASARTEAVYRLSTMPTAKIWRRLRGDLLALSGYAFCVAFTIRGVGHAPWPHKPKLLCVPAKTHPKAKKGRRKHPKLRERPLAP
jgi:hypothetical protein